VVEIHGKDRVDSAAAASAPLDGHPADRKDVAA
jgi:hypothetical protein